MCVFASVLLQFSQVHTTHTRNRHMEHLNWYVRAKTANTHQITVEATCVMQLTFFIIVVEIFFLLHSVGKTKRIIPKNKTNEFSFYRLTNSLRGFVMQFVWFAHRVAQRFDCNSIGNWQLWKSISRSTIMETEVKENNEDSYDRLRLMRWLFGPHNQRKR